MKISRTLSTTDLSRVIEDFMKNRLLKGTRKLNTLSLEAEDEFGENSRVIIISETVRIKDVLNMNELIFVAELSNWLLLSFYNVKFA